MIVKNEAANLPRCLRSVRSLVDEIIIVDTGSTDGTVAIAESFGARVTPFAWVEDFAAARNESLRLCTGDWVLILDADESVDALDHAAIRQACSDRGPSAFYLTVRNYFLDGTGKIMGQSARLNDGRYREGSEYSHCGDFPLLRLCRRFPDLRFEGRIHELLLPYFEQRKLPVGSLEAVIHHFGKVDLAREEEKKIRYLKMAQEQALADPRNTQAWFNVMIQGASAQNWNLVIKAATTILALQPQPPALVLTTLALAYQETRRPAEAIPPLKRLLSWDPDNPLALSRMAISLAQTSRGKEALVLLERTIQRHPELPVPRLTLAEVQLSDGMAAGALETLKQAVEACPSDQELREHLINLEIQLGQDVQATLDAWAGLRAIAGGGGGRWHALVAAFLLKSGETSKGRTILEQGLNLHPKNPELLRLDEVSRGL
jgi:tetratricopeptide (TPR) repeat protein